MERYLRLQTLISNLEELTPSRRRMVPGRHDALDNLQVFHPFLSTQPLQYFGASLVF